VAVNYIKQLTEALMRFSDDDRLNPSHVSLYLALFQFWNMNRFQNPISINRSEAMRVSKIGSNATYHRCIKQLHQWGYLEYIPSYNPMRGSKINMFNFETSNEQAVNGYHSKNEQVVGQVLVPFINSKNNINKTNKSKDVSKTPKTPKRFSPPLINDVIEFFKEKKSDKQQAELFFNHFQSNGWKVGGKTPMKDWKAAARNWIIRAEQYQFQKMSPAQQRLHVSQNKDYSEPL
jgi:hypothetical protein